MIAQRKINLEILSELKKLANEIFDNEIHIKEGVYSSAELAIGAKNGKMIYPFCYTNGNSLLSVEVESFKCSFERESIFLFVWKFERLLNISEKNKARFSRCIEKSQCA